MIIIDLIYNLAVLIALSVLSGFIDLRFNRTDLKGKILQGLLFGATAIRYVKSILFNSRNYI